MPNKKRKGKIMNKVSLEDFSSIIAQRAAQRAAAVAAAEVKTNDNNENKDVIDSSTPTPTASIIQSPPVENASAPDPPPPSSPSAVPKSSCPSQSVPKSAANSWSQGRYRTDRAVSAYPMASESITTVTTMDGDASSRQPRSQSVVSGRTGRGRHFLLSAVSDTANLTPMLRPDAGGSKGRPISVYTNHFPVKLDYNAKVNQYDVEIMVIDRDSQPRVARKDERWKVMQLIAQKKKDFPVVW